MVITIDDGYRDFYEVAYPVLRENHIPATIFTATGLVDGSCWFWWDKLSYIFENADMGNVVRTIGELEVQFDLTSVAGRRAAWKSASDIMRFLPNEQKIAEINRLAESFELILPEMAPVGFQGFSWDQVREMQGNGMTFAPHTVNHPILARVSDEEARWEIEESAKRIAEQTGKRANVFCYPQGGPPDFTPVHRRMIADAGLEGCYIAYQDIDFTGDRFALPRYGSPNNWDQFVWIMCGAEYLFLRLRRLIGRKYKAPKSYWVGHDPEVN